MAGPAGPGSHSPLIVLLISLPAPTLRRHIFRSSVRVSMTLDKHTRERMLAHCGEIPDDDGVDPREFFKTRRTRDKRDRKALQLCKQVAETLGLVLEGDFGDERLHNLQVVSVNPAPDASQLAVTLRADIPAGRVGAQEILDRLAAVAGRLRCEVAAAIRRKRAPQLVFHLVGPGQSEEVQP